MMGRPILMHEVPMTNESKTLFIPLWGKAAMSREGLLPDPAAEAIVASLAGGFPKVDRSRKLAIYLALRAALYDGYVRDFLAAHQDGLILQLGVGLDSRVDRVKADVPWYDLDMPEVVEMRRQYFPETDRYRLIAAPALPASWLAQVPQHPHALILAEGLSMYLSKEDMQTLAAALQEHFPRATFIFDAYTPLAARLSRWKNPVNAVKARIDFAVQDAAAVQALFPAGRVTLDSDIITPEGLARLSGLDQVRFRWMGRFSGGLYRVYGVEWKQPAP